MAGINAAVVGLLLAALYQPVWQSAVLAPTDLALAAVGFYLLRVQKLPILALAGLLVRRRPVAGLRAETAENGALLSGAPFLHSRQAASGVGIEVQAQAVDAVALAGLGRPVREDVTQVGAALATGDLHRFMPWLLSSV